MSVLSAMAPDPEWSAGHWLLHPFLREVALERAGRCAAPRAGLACVPRTPGWLVGHDLFIEGRGQLDRLPSWGSESVVCEKPWELENVPGGEGQSH